MIDLAALKSVQSAVLHIGPPVLFLPARGMKLAGWHDGEEVDFPVAVLEIADQPPVVRTRRAIVYASAYLPELPKERTGAPPDHDPRLFRSPLGHRSRVRR